MHNAALAALGMQGWRYQLLPVAPPLLEQTVRALGDSGFAGANVTIPHKQAALALADSASDVARAVGAANTLTFTGDGAIAAENTDAPGLIAAIGEPLAGRSALVLGAGGSARAAVWALLDAGAARVSIHNRTRERAQELAQELSADVAEQPLAADVLVNCTSIGLRRGRARARPAGARRGQARRISAGRRPGLPRGRHRSSCVRRRAIGSRTIDGLDVLVAQGALSLELWTGREAPLDVMRAAARAS